LKPGNILVDERQGFLKIGDFGLSTTNTEESMLKAELLRKLGTPSYMAPELQSKNKLERLELVDMYSLGVIYYELLRVFATDHERVTSLRSIQ
jgi:serine/threonine protein kinase